MEFLSDPNLWIAFAMLTALEIVLGVDNIIFISILVGRLPEHLRDKARRLGLGFAMLSRLSLDQMQEKLATRFPRRYPVAGLAELNLQAPRLSLRPERNRLNAVMAVEASGPALRRTYSGSMDVDFALRFEPSDQTVRATELEVLALQLEGLPAQASTLLAGLGPTLAQQALREVVLYQVRPRDLALADSLGLQPGRMTVTPQGLVIELAPRPQP